MPPRFAYWTIIAGGLPTAFRTAEREELLPTFKRIQEKHPDAEMKYFARGRLWASPEEAREAAEAERRRRAAPRPREWRPGGEHRDPRQRFKDAQKTRNQEHRRERFDRRTKGPAQGSAKGPAQGPGRGSGPGAGGRPGAGRRPGTGRGPGKPPGGRGRRS